MYINLTTQATFRKRTANIETCCEYRNTLQIKKQKNKKKQLKCFQRSLKSAEHGLDTLVFMVCEVLKAEACTTKQVQHTQGIFLLPAFTKPNKGNLAKRPHDAVYQLGMSTQGFPI